MHEIEQLPHILLLLSAAVICVAIFRAAGLSPVLGYLVAGAIIGPYGMAIIKDTAATATLAEFGVIFLLFSIGLEVSFERLRAMRKQVFGFGSLQVGITAVLIGGIAFMLGLPHEAAIIIGGGLALSSTAIVLQVVAEGGDKSSQTGRLSLAVLLMQDLAVVPLLVLVPLFASSADTILYSMATAFLKALVVLAGIVLVGRLAIRPLFRAIAALHNADIFVATTLLVVLGIAWLTQMTGLSLALGAFIGGVLVAETEYQHQVEADIQPYKGLFLGLFFISVGMMINASFLLENWVLIIGLAVALMLLKATVIFALCRLFNFSRGAAIRSGLLLSQGGEFAFILFNLAMLQKILDAHTASILLVVVTLSMALTPLAAILGKRTAILFERRKAATPDRVQSELSDLHNHVIIAGYGRMGQLVAKLLAAENIPFVAVDSNPDEVAAARRRGEPVYYGDALRKPVLSSVGAKRASAIFITVKNEEKLEKMIKIIRARLPETPMVVRARDVRQALRLKAAGANEAIPELFEGSLTLGAAILKVMQVPEPEISRIIDVFRGYNNDSYYGLTMPISSKKPDA